MIVPVAAGERTAFHGTCDRDHLGGMTVLSFERDLNDVMNHYADMLRQLHALQGYKSDQTGDSIKRSFVRLIDGMLERDNVLFRNLSKFAVENEFLDLVKTSR